MNCCHHAAFLSRKCHAEHHFKREHNVTTEGTAIILTYQHPVKKVPCWTSLQEGAQCDNRRNCNNINLSACHLKVLSQLQGYTLRSTPVVHNCLCAHLLSKCTEEACFCYLKFFSYFLNRKLWCFTPTWTD